MSGACVLVTGEVSRVVRRRRSAGSVVDKQIDKQVRRPLSSSPDGQLQVSGSRRSSLPGSQGWTRTSADGDE